MLFFFSYNYFEKDFHLNGQLTRQMRAYKSLKINLKHQKFTYITTIISKGIL